MRRACFATVVLAAGLALPGAASACNKNHGNLDSYNEQWRAVLGIEFDNPVIKASSMNGLCWLGDEDIFHTDRLGHVWRFRSASKGFTIVFEAPGFDIKPNYAAYSDTDDAYLFGEVKPLGRNLFSIVVTPNGEGARAEVLASLAKPQEGAAEGGETYVQLTGETTIDDIKIDLVTHHVDRGLISDDSYKSYAVFEAPGNPDLLAVFSGHFNSEADRVGGIPVEETLHQTIRDIERAAPAEGCPFDYSELGYQAEDMARRLGLTFADGVIAAGDMGPGCWLRPLVNERVFKLFEPGETPPDKQVPIWGVWRGAPDGTPDKQTSFLIFALPEDIWKNTRPGWIENGAAPVPRGYEGRRSENYHGEINVEGLDMDLFTTFADGPALTGDFYKSTAVLRAPSRPGTVLILSGGDGQTYARMDGVYTEKMFAEALGLLRLSK